jgi:hypothetical protein
MTKYYEAHGGKKSNVIDFPRAKLRGRGRPKSDKPKSDSGTPELVMKRAYGETAETLDLLLERRLITESQHWCGIHLRWLYTLRYGAPSVRTIDLTHVGGTEVIKDDPQWRALREAEFNDAMKRLSKYGVLTLDICVHNKRPRFLTQNPMNKHYSPQSLQRLVTIKTGLDILVALWGKR